MGSKKKTKDSVSPWASVEYSLLLVLLLVKAVYFIRHWGNDFGYDVGGHVMAIEKISFMHTFLELKSFMYAYHPPTGFLAARLFYMFGVPALESAQLVSIIASLGAFVAFRWMLRILGLLQSPMGIVTLYLTFGIPMQVYLSGIVNLDIILVLFASVALALSIYLFWTPSSQKHYHNWQIGAALVLTLTFALLTKFSGLLLLVIPPLVSLLSPRRQKKKWKTLLWRTAAAGGLSIVAIILVMPYYYLRYYVPTGELFYNPAGNTDWVEDIRAARGKRDANPMAFYRSYIMTQDGNPARLGVTWNALWLAQDRSPQSRLAENIGRTYELVMPLLMLLGLALLFILRPLRTLWGRLGLLLIGLFSVEILALLPYIYKYPTLGYLSNKGIYVAPASLAVGLLIAMPVLLCEKLRRKRMRLAIETSGIILVALFVIVNHVVPVY
jgi:4-amino-4-deoxy-L-arabinose transferase-like glycosyltransferase